jgi:hypothetical protein
MRASKFIEKMFAGRTKGNVVLCSYANDRSEAKTFPPRDMATRDWAKVDAFIKEYDVAGRACYFACCTMMGRTRNKEEVAHINSVYVDLDFKGMVEGEEFIRSILKSLSCPPSAVVHSGNGLHCYWMLEPPQSVEHSASCEDLMRRICAMLAGDVSAAETARVLRLPASHNSKNGEWKDVHVIPELTTWRTYSYAKLDAFFASDAEPLLTYKTTPKKRDAETDRGPRNVYQQLMFDIRADYGQKFDPQEHLDAMTYHDTHGHGIDCTHAAIIGAMAAQGSKVEEVLKVLLGPTKMVYERDKASGEGAWNERQEIKNIKSKFNRFVKKDAQKEKQESAPAPKPSKPEPESKGQETKKSKNEYDFEPPEDVAAQRSNESENPDNWGSPILDLFSSFSVPKLEKKHVPELIGNVAFSNAASMGADPGALAMSLLTVAAAAISSEIKIKVRPEEHSRFVQHATFWTMLVGEAGTKKSPMMRDAMEPLLMIDRQLGKDFKEELRVWEATPKDERTEKPVRKSKVLNDFSIESASKNLIENPQGQLIYCDEIRQFFGAVNRYAGGKAGHSGGEHSNRAFMLGMYNREWVKTLRMTRDQEGYVSASVLGSIQPDLLHHLASEAQQNDGLIQRVTPVFIPKEWRAMPVDGDIEYPYIHFYNLIDALHRSPLSHGTTLHFSKKAHEWRIRMDKWIEVQYDLNKDAAPQFASALRKWDGQFARWCMLFHMIENPSDAHTSLITEETTRQVFAFMTDYLFDHTRVLFELTNANDEHEKLRLIVLHCVVKNKTEITARDIVRATKKFDKMEGKDMRRLFDKLEALNYGRVRAKGKNNRYDSYVFELNPNAKGFCTAAAADERARLMEVNQRWEEAKRIKILIDSPATSHRKH